MPDQPLAYFITFRTYGSWLHGDARGSVDSEHHGIDEPFLPRDDFRRGYAQRRLRTGPFALTTPMRSIVLESVVEVCAHREWDLVAANVRTNHIHVVVTAGTEPESVMRDLKAYATRALRRAGMVQQEQPVWAGHGSTRYLWSSLEVEACTDYSVNLQGSNSPGTYWPPQSS